MPQGQVRHTRGHGNQPLRCDSVGRLLRGPIGCTRHADQDHVRDMQGSAPLAGGNFSCKASHHDRQPPSTTPRSFPYRVSIPVQYCINAITSSHVCNASTTMSLQTPLRRHIITSYLLLVHPTSMYLTANTIRARILTNITPPNNITAAEVLRVDEWPGTTIERATPRLNQLPRCI
jgi:hypothetical protein